MPTYQVHTREANAQEIKDHQEKIAATKEHVVRATLACQLAALAIISSFISLEPKLAAGIIAGIILLKQLAKIPANDLYIHLILNDLFPAAT